MLRKSIYVIYLLKNNNKKIEFKNKQRKLFICIYLKGKHIKVKFTLTLHFFPLRIMLEKVVINLYTFILCKQMVT